MIDILIIYTLCGNPIAVKEVYSQPIKHIQTRLIEESEIDNLKRNTRGEIMYRATEKSPCYKI